MNIHHHQKMKEVYIHHQKMMMIMMIVTNMKMIMMILEDHIIHTKITIDSIIILNTLQKIMITTTVIKNF